DPVPGRRRTADGPGRGRGVAPGPSAARGADPPKVGGRTPDLLPANHGPDLGSGIRADRRGPMRRFRASGRRTVPGRAAHRNGAADGQGTRPGRGREVCLDDWRLEPAVRVAAGTLRRLPGPGEPTES